MLKFFGDRVKTDFPLAPLTTFGIGGPADYFVSIGNEEELDFAVSAARRAGTPVTALGFGSNVLISDLGARGLVFVLDGDFKKMFFEPGGCLKAGAGARLPKFVTFAAEQGRTGMEPLAGVPGTVGGGIFMNAGTREGEIKDHLKSVRVYSLQEGKFQDLSSSAIEFGYRRSSLQKGGHIIVSAIFDFPIANDKKEALDRIKRLMERRKATQPIDTKNVGSIFKNPPGDFAARLIEQAGLKGERRGGAVVSPIHANFIVNAGGAKAEDVLALAEKIKAVVLEKFGVSLEPEFRCLGEFQ